MHEDEVAVDAGLVRRLLAAQHPRWAGLPLAPVASAGTDHALFRLGPDMAVRLPRIPAAAAQVAKEQEFLPRLAPRLPLPVPEPLAAGRPGEGYPFSWSVCRWLPGRDAAGMWLDAAAARAVAGFLHALRAIPAERAPAPGAHNAGRGAALAARDSATRAAIAACAGWTDAALLLRAWDRALAAPPWPGPAVWLHGDLHGPNLLLREGQVAGVLDFGCLAAGDPACDLAGAWAMFDAPARRAFRDAAGAEEADWARGRGWALSIAAVALPYYRRSNAVLAASAGRVFAEILAEARKDEA